jgi:hypothetical protein
LQSGRRTRQTGQIDGFYQLKKMHSVHYYASYILSVRSCFSN